MAPPASSSSSPKATQRADIGWGAAAFTISLPDDLQVSPRWSAVFHRENGEWKAVQIHASVGITNDQLFGMDFEA